MPPTWGRISAAREAVVRPGSSVVTTWRSGATTTTPTSGAGGGAAGAGGCPPPQAATTSSAKRPAVLAIAPLGARARVGRGAGGKAGQSLDKAVVMNGR